MRALAHLCSKIDMISFVVTPWILTIAWFGLYVWLHKHPINHHSIGHVFWITLVHNFHFLATVHVIYFVCTGLHMYNKTMKNKRKLEELLTLKNISFIVDVGHI